MERPVISGSPALWNITEQKVKSPESSSISPSHPVSFCWLKERLVVVVMNFICAN
jgi:hypothetical protein